ncbi:MAG: porin [Acetobacteraceae bacterium]|nr:porin [Acetobacteraceae bacterium]
MTTLCLPAFAQTQPAPAPSATTNTETGNPGAAPAQPPGWIDTLKFGAQFDVGATVNPSSPSDNLNFGRLFDDKSNQVLLNQVLLSVARLPDPKATDYDFGFQIQALYGSDARYVQFLGELNSTFASRYQLAFINANLQAHLPWLTEGGIDVKVGQMPTPLGFETIDPSTNPFYSHSYIFNFGLPFVSTGILTTTHVTSMLDVYAGIDTGVNTTFGSGDNNGGVAGTAGVNLTFLDGNLTVLGLSHFGPENPTFSVPKANCCWRSLNDIVITYKASDKLTFVTELNLVNDARFKANAFGGAQYVSYALNDQVTLNGRAEIYRDDNGFFVAAFPGNHDFVNAQLGYPTSVVSAGPATYSEFTLGLTYKPTVPYLSDHASSFMIRPEVRYDRTLTTTHAYNDFRDRGQFTFAADAVIGF